MSLSAILTKTRPRHIDATDPMPWGKYKGIPIDQVPRDYLVWALKNMDACRPDHERFWPEYTAVLEGLVGPHAPEKPAMLGIVPLCERLQQANVRLEARGNQIAALDPLPADLAESVEANKAVLLAVLRIAGGSQQLGGSARLIRGAELRSLVKGWYGRMSRQFHPDAGGNADSQKAVNACYKSLTDLLTQWEASK